MPKVSNHGGIAFFYWIKQQIKGCELEIYG